MKRLVVMAVLVLCPASLALAGSTEYHVYKKKSANKCEIDSRDHDQWKSARGSDWMCIGHAGYRMDAEKIFKQAGCAH